MQITTIGLDIAKNVFQVHGIDAAEKVIARKRLRRGQVMAFFEALAPCLVGMEACASSHHWARELTKLGHEVRLMPAKDVVGATTIAAVVTDPKAFRSGRDFAAWIGTRAATEFDRWQTETWADLETGRSIFPSHSYCWCTFCLAACTPASGEVSVAHSASRAASVQGRRGRAGQQDGADRLGFAGQGRDLPGAPTRGSVRRLDNGRMRLRPCVHELQG